MKQNPEYYPEEYITLVLTCEEMGYPRYITEAKTADSLIYGTALRIFHSEGISEEMKEKIQEWENDFYMPLGRDAQSNEQYLKDWLGSLEMDLQAVIVEQKPTAYYVLVDDDTTKIKTTENIYRDQEDASVTFTFEKVGGILDTTAITWKVMEEGEEEKEIALTEGKNKLSFDFSQKTGNLPVKVYYQEEEILQLNLIVYKSPTVVFQIDTTTYKGEFGFDDGKRFELKQDYQKLQLPGKKNYKVRMLSLLDGQTVNIELDIKGWGKVKNDPNYAITLKTSNDNGKIKIQGKSQLTLPSNQISSKGKITVPIYSEAFNHNNYTTPGNIEAYDPQNRLIGKLQVFCADITKKKLVIVYVNHTNPPNYLDTQLPPKDILDYLNNKSHNQFHIEWELDTLNDNGNTLPMRLDIYSDYTKNKSKKYRDKDELTFRVWRMYSATYGYEVSNAKNHYFLFITDISFSDSQGNLGGVASFKNRYCLVLKVPKDPNFKVKREHIAHEVGHLLDIKHTFSDTDNKMAPYLQRYIIKGATNNFMDYTQNTRNMFFLYQYRVRK